MTFANDDIGTGFADVTLQSQKAFRAILDAMASPGTVARLDGLATPPPGMSEAAAVVLLTLGDYDTPVWLPQGPHHANWARWLRFHTGAPLAQTPALAHFAILDGAIGEPRIADLDAGDERYPDRSATAIVVCSALEGGEVVELRGPGIQTSKRIAPRGLDDGFWAACIENAAKFPLGVDLMLVAGDSLAALPRSVRIRRLEERC